MVVDALTLDEFQVFVAVVEAGSFSAAARRLNRAQSAVTCAVQRLEEQVGAPLLDRSAYRLGLSEAGRTLLPQARRILDDVGRFRASARQIVRGLEAELRVLLAGGLLVTVLMPALVAFRNAFPTVRLRLVTQPLSMGFGRDAAGVAAGEADIRILVDLLLSDVLERRTIMRTSLVTVAAASHPLAKVARPLTDDDLRDHLQIAPGEAREAVAGEERRIAALDSWRVTDVGTQRALLRAGLGWGSLPDMVARENLDEGRLVQLSLSAGTLVRRSHAVSLVAAYRRDEPLGPAGSCLVPLCGGTLDHAQREELWAKFFMAAPRRLSDCVAGQGVCHGVEVLMMALRMPSRRRMQAIRATFFGRPRAMSWV